MIVEMADVAFSYGSAPVLHGVSAGLEAGQSVALVGSNGAGKTTLTRLLVGLEQPDRGRVTVGDVSPVEPSAIAPVMGYVVQHPVRQLFARTALDDMVFGSRQVGYDLAIARTRAITLLERLGMPDVAQVHPHDLSPGRQKLLAFGSALVHRPRLLILDEPTQGLDRPARETVAAMVRDHIEEGGMALSVSHDAAFVLDMASHVWLLDQGRMELTAEVSDVFGSPEAAGRFGLEVPASAELANRMEWPPDDRPTHRVRERVATGG